MRCQLVRDAGLDFDCCRSCHSDEIVDFGEIENYDGVDYVLCCAGVSAVKEARSAAIRGYIVNYGKGQTDGSKSEPKEIERDGSNDAIVL